MADSNGKTNKKSKKNDWQNDGLKKSGGVNLDVVMDRQVGDRRFEREKSSYKDKGGVAASSTFDAFQRMAAGLDGRTLAEKIADPNRITWEQYKKENEDKLDLVGNEVKKMIEYRAELDRERERKLRPGTNHTNDKATVVDSDDDDSDDGSKHKKKSKKHKKHKEKKHKKRKRSDREKDESSQQESNEQGESIRLSDFMKSGDKYYSDSD
eukprot:gene9848-13248_t